ncbi:MAG: glycosyltransferase [Granulosicoccus sp.]|nr:glycosyltransferase [Granulosicoccus sp.]
MKLRNRLFSSQRRQRKLAHIDCVAGNVVQGWVFDRQNPDYAPQINILCRGKKVGEGAATVFRQDLKDNGFGDGAHGFSITIDLSTSASESASLALVDAESGLNLGANECSIGGEYSTRAEIISVTASGISGSISSQSVQLSTEDTVCVFMDGVFACSARCLSTARSNEFRFDIALPASAFDGKEHSFIVSVAGYSTDCKEIILSMPAVQLPSEQIGAGSRYRGHASSAALASYRYESLRASVRKLVTKDQIDNLTVAHDMVVEGPVARNNYPRLKLPATSAPVVSVVIPVFNQFPLTYHCLAACILAGSGVEFEIILVDDGSTDNTGNIETLVENLTVVRNNPNQGFVRSCNRGAEAARGDYIVFLNNDTEVTSGWLDELLHGFSLGDNIGATGAKLIYPDGVLQDAGGLVWDNGLPWNAGNGGSSADPRFNYTRDVDYLTGAALMVSRSSWQEVGAFGEEYVPAYYEDTDLAFKLRAAGYRTLYCPLSTVVHFEGKSNGTDTASGVKQHQVTNAGTFTAKWKDAFTGLGKEGVDLHLNKDRNCQFRILMIDHAFPCEGLDAGSYAAIQEIRLMQALGSKITFVPQNFSHLGMYTETLQRMGVECVYAPFCSSMDDFLADRGSEFDAVYVTRYGVAEKVLPAIREHTDARIIFNNADLHFLREMRAAKSKGQTDMSGPLQTRDRELWVMRNVDAILSYNETEHTIIASHLMRSDNIFKCPWVLEDRFSSTPFEQRSGLAFLGGFGHPPNREAVEFFIHEVVPLLRESGHHIPFHIYGSSFPPELADLAAADVIVEGFVESLDTLFDQHRVFVAPLISGAGIKGKVLDSMAYGLPSVLTPVAAEATGLVNGTSTLIAETPEQWRDAIVSLYSDQDRWEDLRREAHQLVHAEYSLDSGVERMRSVFDFVGLQTSDSDTLAGTPAQQAKAA